MRPVPYIDRKFRIIFAFLAGFYMLVHGTRFDIHRALVSPMFYVVLTISCVAAWLLIEWVHYVTKRLDKIYSWHSKLLERIIAQLLLAVVVPLLFDLFIFSIYFTIIGTNIFENGFFHADLPFIGVLLVVLSCYYCIHYFVATNKNNPNAVVNDNKYAIQHDYDHTSIIFEKRENSVITTENKFKLLAAICPGLDTEIDLETDILYFYSANKQVYMVGTAGTEYPVVNNLTTLSELLQDINYVRISRSVILNFSNVVDYMEGDKRDTLSLMFTDSNLPALKQHNEDYFAVTKNYIPAVIAYFEE